ncbi:MAG: RluA family pseudouridine synthase [Clostridiaceae bacterium]|jgi:23S rRNA pseudouridine1911/1915/1917 synthase|nr:RluA family pseudouridine synthase [Clostridiaceae bacterium]
MDKNDENFKPTILFEDNHLLVVVKPFDMPVQEDESKDPDLLNYLKKYLVEKYDKPGDAYLGLVHRLDRPTGGVMVFAKTSKAAARISESIRDGSFDKRYFAVVTGVPREKKDRLVHFLKKNEEKNIVSVVPMLTEGAKRAELDYNVLQSKEGVSLLGIKLLTGRGHQIRVQMSVIGNPLVGDVKYGYKGKTPVQLALWAVELRFPHPVSGETLVFRVYPPEDTAPWDLFDIESLLSLK